MLFFYICLCLLLLVNIYTSGCNQRMFCTKQPFHFLGHYAHAHVNIFILRNTSQWPYADREPRQENYLRLCLLCGVRDEYHLKLEYSVPRRTRVLITVCRFLRFLINTIWAYQIFSWVYLPILTLREKIYIELELVSKNV